MKSSHNKLTSRYIIGIAIAALLLIIALLATGFLRQDDSNSATDTSKVIANENITTQSEDYVTYTATSEGSALEQLQSINDSVEVVESELGKYVDSINGLKGGTDGKYWTFYVNGEMASVGADAFNPEGGEVIEWKFQAL